MNFNDIANIQIPEGEVYSIHSGATLLWSKPSEPSGYRLLYLQNGPVDGTVKQYGYSIDTGIVWRDVFMDPNYTLPGLEVTLIYSQDRVEGGTVAGAHPRNGVGYTYRDQGGYWRYFGYNGGEFSLDVPSEDDRTTLTSAPWTSNQVYTAIQVYSKTTSGYLASLSVPEVQASLTKTSFRYTWANASAGHHLYLFSDNSQVSYGKDTACCGGTRIYGYTIWTLEDGVRVTKLYDGVPWMDVNNVPCFKDLVTGTLQYNCAEGGAVFMYGTI